MIHKILALLLLAVQASAATLNITNYAGIGDCAHITVSVTTNLAVIHTTNTFTGADVGKLMQLFKAGYFASLSSTGNFSGNYQGTPTNHQDMVVEILSVSDGTNVTISAPCGVTATDIRATYGTQNKTAFDAVIAAASSNDVIYLPAGNYMLIPPSALDTNYTQANIFSCLPTITLYNGGLTFLGDGTNSTIITGNGAWQQKGLDTAYRGYMWRLQGPITNNGPLYFNGIQFDGNATRKHDGYAFWPSVPTDGSGWDVTHHAITVATATGLDFDYISITNCLFTRWHGETIQGISTATGFLDVGNCGFFDGNSTVINWNGEHDFHNNFVDDYYQVAEDGQFTATSEMSYIRENVFSNIYGTGAIALTGAYTNVTHGGYTISSNSFSLTAPKHGIITAGAKYINILSNYFNGGGIAIGTAGQQGNDYNREYLIAGNRFTNSQFGISFSGSGNNRAVNILVTNNYATPSINFALASQGAGSWTTNAVFRGNYGSKGLWSVYAYGQYFLDDPSNDFPFYSVTDSAATNLVGYGRGYRQALAPATTSAVFYLDDSVSSKIPNSAKIWITNQTRSATLYTGASLSQSIAMAAGYSQIFYWRNGAWHINNVQKLRARIP